MQPDPKTPKSEPEPASDLDTLLKDAIEGMDQADAGALLLAEAMRMAQEED
jgi:hypothetical protein